LSLEVCRRWCVTAPLATRSSLAARVRVCLVAHSGVAVGDTSDRLLHSETIQFEYPQDSQIPSVAILFPCLVPFGSPPEHRPHTEPCGPCPFTRNVFFHATLQRSGGLHSGTGQLGLPDTNETGEDRGSQRNPHFDDQASTIERALSSLKRDRCAASDTPVASFALWVRSRCRLHTVARRPPRPVPRGPCERRALSRSKVSSVCRRAVQPARTEMRTNSQYPGRSFGDHVMRIRRIFDRTSPLHQEPDLALSRAVLTLAEPPFTRSVE